MKWSRPPHSTLSFPNSQHIPKSPQKQRRPWGLSRVMRQVSAEPRVDSFGAGTLSETITAFITDMRGSRPTAELCAACPLSPAAPQRPCTTCAFTHSPRGGADGGSEKKEGPSHGTNQAERSSESQQVYLLRAHTSHRPGPRAGFHLGEGNRGCRIMTEALGKAGDALSWGRGRPDGEAGPWTAPVAREERWHHPRRCSLQPCSQLGTRGHVHTLSTPSEDALISGAPSG